MRELSSLATTVIACLLFSCYLTVIESAEERGSDRSQRLDWGWKILTKQNFSSETRRHPHILLMVTIPWSGESRSLMKQLREFVADQPEKFGHLRLMVIHKNSQKLLADVLEAADDITLYYYHQSISHKYHGSLSAEKILSSVKYFASHKSEEVPLKHLHTRKELKLFLKSTDKAVLLIELCGWLSKVLHKKSNKNFSSHLNFSKTDGIHKSILFSKVDDKLPLNLKKYQKGLANEGPSCVVENGMDDSCYAGKFSWENSSVRGEEGRYEAADINLSCTEERFEQFKSLFSKFKMLAREFFLPPERIRFGLISERSMLPYVGVDTMGAWLVMLQFNGCPSCSVTLTEGDDLRKFLQEHHSPVMQLDVKHNLEPAFPANRPSLVLFIDRQSDSQVIREKSKSALDAFRMLALNFQPSYKRKIGAHRVFSQSSTVQIVSERQSTAVSDSSHLYFSKDQRVPKLVKVKDNVAIILNEGQGILSDKTASYAHGNTVYDALLNFINKRSLDRKQRTKLSLLAKENGFQLLSDDFEVQVIDSLSYYKETNHLSDVNKHAGMNLGDKTFKLHHQSNEKKNDNLLAAIEVPVDDAKQAAHGDTEDDIKKFFETNTENKRSSNKLGIVQARDTKNAFGDFLDSLINEDDKRCRQNDFESSINHDENSVPELEVPFVGTCMEKGSADDVDCISSSIGAAEEVPFVDPEGDFSSNNEAEIEKNGTSKSSDGNIQHQPFWGSFFFIDGAYRLLNSLSGNLNIPSLVLLDPVEQHHFVFNEDRDIDYSSMFNFVKKFLDRSLSPYQPSSSSIMNVKEPPRPPFVNLNFHEADAIPRVTTSTFCEMVFGFNPCVTENAFPTSQVQNLGAAWKTDVLVLFGSSWCGFCLRMELLVREVYRAFKSLKNMLKCESSFINPVCFHDDGGNVVEYRLPSVFLMDCSKNDCGFFLKHLGRLFPSRRSRSHRRKQRRCHSLRKSSTPLFDPVATHFADYVASLRVDDAAALGGYTASKDEATLSRSLRRLRSAPNPADSVTPLQADEDTRRLQYLSRQILVRRQRPSHPSASSSTSSAEALLDFPASVRSLLSGEEPDLIRHCRFLSAKIKHSNTKNELYPELLLYSALNKSAVTYEGDMLVANIIKFVASQGRSSQFLNKYRGYLWKQPLSNYANKREPALYAKPPLQFIEVDLQPQLASVDDRKSAAESQSPNTSGGRRVVVQGSVLSATDKLRGAAPFDGAVILITLIEEGDAFHGVILNKPMKWSIFENLGDDMDALEQAPLSYGGPIRAPLVGLPLVSLARKPTDGYAKVVPGVYFGSPAITSMVIKGIKSGDQSCHDYWFFFGYSGWKWDQLFDELDEGAWDLRDDPIGILNWPNI